MQRSKYTKLKRKMKKNKNKTKQNNAMRKNATLTIYLLLSQVTAMKD